MHPVLNASTFVELFSTIRAMVFDFDGTLVNSNAIKRRAFELCFAGFPEYREDILRYCWGHHHTPRDEKFRYVYEQILEQPYTANVAANLHARFESATTRQILEAPEIPGASAFLQRIESSHLTAVLSSTPQAILTDLVVRRGWRDYVQVIQGAPVKKAAWLRDFRRARGLGASEILFFGDAEEDAEAARTAGCAFVTVGNEGEFPGCRFAIPDFASLLAT